MLAYVTIGTADLEKSKAFWGAALEPIGGKVLFDMGRIAFIGAGPGQPMLAVCKPYDEKDPQPGNGTMLAFAAGSTAMVDELYAKAIELGATDEGEPGQRMPTFYGGYIRDPDGNKAVFCHMG